MTSSTGGTRQAELDAAANQVVPLGLQELVQEGGRDPPELVLQTGRRAGPRGGAVLGVVFDFGFGAAGSQRGHDAVL